MREHRTLSLASAGGRPASHDEPFRPPAAMIRFRAGGASKLFLISFIFVLLSIWTTSAQAAPIPVGSGRGGRNGSWTPLSRCPAIFNPASKTATTAVGSKTGRSRAAEPSPSCRYFFKERFGTLTTPNFPSAFPVPFICSWIIDATGFEPDSFITLYLTQMYLTRGVTAVQYSFRNETVAVGRKVLDELHTLRPRPYSVYRIKARYLEVLVNLHELVNANLRVERRLMDVYGFNITYEIQPNGSRIRSDTCNAVNCTFNGHCYANQNYSQFQCSCLPEFSGKYCQFGPECNPEKGINVCKNGGTCGYRTGLTVVRCSCPPNYNGSLCEFRREFIPAKECLSRFRLNCSHQCVVTDKGGAACRCPLDQALRSDLLTCYPLVPLRIMGRVEVERSASLNDTRLVDGVTALLRKLADDYTASLFSVASVHLAEPNSNLLQFVLWNSEKFNMSWTNVVQDPTVAALKSKGYSIGRNRSLSAGQTTLDPSKGRIPRYIAPFATLAIPQHWNNSYTSFVNQINTKTWRVMGEMIYIRNFSTIQVPALLIEWVKLDVKGQVREGYPFTVACNANGSKKLKLRWYKDGHPVDAAFALLRNMSIFVHQVQDLRGYFTLYLEVKQASVADRGEYECRANDWEQTVRKSVFLDVITPPILDLMPINPTVLLGTAVNLTCRDENHLARRSTTKYVWLKNGLPIESSCEEIIEDLTPVGSLLKITSIQHSTNYTCRGENGSAPANKTTHIFVVQPDRACPQQKSGGVEWLMTATDATNYQFCPAGYVGVARRRCKSVEEFLEGDVVAANRVLWSWEEPDFAHCSDRIISELYRQMKLIALGYIVTDVQSVFNKFVDAIQRKVKATDQNRSNPKRTPPDQTPFPYLPGEGNALLEMAKNLETFVWKKTNMIPPSFWEPTAINYLYALDALLSMPQDFCRPDGGVMILRLIQNHLSMLSMSPSGGYPLGAIEPHLLKNSHFALKELKYKRMLPALPSQTGFKSLKQLAPAQFFLHTDGSNVTMDFQTTNQLLSGGEYLCALLHLQPTNHSRGWDMDSCSVERLSNPSAFRCHCSHQGTVVFLYAERDSIELVDDTLDLWVIVYFAAATSHLILIIGLFVLSARWYQRRNVWAWFQIQLNISLLPPSSAYFLQEKLVASDPFWTIMLTLMSYVFVTTVWAMIMYLKTSNQVPSEQKTERFSQRNAKLIVLSLGVPLTLSGIQTLLEEISTGSPFISWLSQISSISGIFFCFTYGVLVIVIVVLYAYSTSKPGEFEKANAFNQEGPDTNNNPRYNLCCLCLAVLGLLFTIFMLIHLHEPSLRSHCNTALLHLILVMVWAALMFRFSGSGYVCAFWCFWSRSKLPGDETVSEMLNATAMMESPQRRSLLSPEQHPPNGDPVENANHKSRKISHSSVDEGFNPMIVSRTKRSNRSGPASSPLLQRAGLGPDVLRAFGMEHPSHKPSERQQTPTGEPTDLNSSGRNRVNSATMSDGMTRDDLDSGFGPSGGGGSQKLNGLDKFSDALKLLSRIRWKIPQLGFTSNGSTSGGGSFRSRQSTMSSATTAEFGGERSSSVTTEETELPAQVSEDVESLMAHYRLRRSRTRWTEDYNQEKLELDSSEVSNLTLMCKPFRGRCYIRCSPEKVGSNALWGRLDTKDRQNRESPPQNNCCERCWHNPETPFCDLCLTDNPDAIQHRSGIISVRAVIENPPALPDKDVGEYLEMDPAGSLAIDQQRVNRLEVYYNVMPTSANSNAQTVTTEFNQNNKEKLSSITSTKSSSISPSLLHKKNILSGRIVKKYRISLRNVVHSTQQQLRHRTPNEIDLVGHPGERLSLRDQTVTDIRDVY